MPDALRLALGTLTVLRVPAPRTVDRRTAGWAVLLAPVAALPLGLAVALTLWACRSLDVAPLVPGLLAVGVLVVGTRALHVDGLSDTADGLTASYDRERSLAVMRTGTSGPAGGVAVLLVLGLQAAALTWMALTPSGPWLAGLLVCLSRASLALACVRGVPAARADGLGTTFTQSVGVPAVVLTWIAVAALAGAGAQLAGASFAAGVLATIVAAVVVAVVVRRAVTRLGGVTGDVLGACIEVCLAALLVALSGSVPVSFGA
ncbi:MAG: adenosylcobinamide-GDP ribazoletransferase [Marmoricola sp.]|nr:adenosylcobinamide-GDP ribazoletransferase [Marmoricola sp.]